MRKLILTGLMAATAIPTLAVPTVASAQPRQIRHDRREVRQDRRELRQDRRELGQDRRQAGRVRYAAPYRGWAYRTLTPGYQLRPVFWEPRYFVNYSTYRLHAPGYNERWIRYGDDLILVNVRTGRVIEVIRNRW